MVEKKIAARDDTPAFLLDQQEEREVGDSLEQLKKLVSALKLVNADIKTKEEELAFLKKQEVQLSHEAIPDLLNQKGLSRVKLDTGDEVRVSECVSATVPDEKRDKFFEWLEGRGDDDIVKTLVAIDRTEHEVLTEFYAVMNKLGLSYKAEKNVHPSTLKKYFKELLGLDLDEDERARRVADGRCLRTQDVLDVATVFTFFDTKIVEPKKKSL